MKRLLLPIDFSPASKSALTYAMRLGDELQAKLTVIHVFPEPYPENPFARGAVQDVIDNKKTELLNKFYTYFSLSEDVIKDMELDFKIGNPLEEVIRVRKEKNIDLLVIGTRKKHNLAEYLFGSFSSELMQKASVPVLVIPEGVVYRPIKNISFATVDYDKENEKAKDLQVFAGKLNAQVNSFYVNVLPVDFSTLSEDILNIEEKERISDLGVVMVVARSVMEGVTYFLKKHPTDLLVMCAIHRKGIQKLLHSSLTQKMVYHTEIPLLILHQR